MRGMNLGRLSAMLCVAAMCFGVQPAVAQTYYDQIRIGWDYRKQTFVSGGVYSRLKKLSDGSLACVYSEGSGVYIRKRNADGWGAPVLVATDARRQYGYTNAELTELADGRLVYAWNARPHGNTDLPYKIMLCYSADKGQTWSAEETLFVAGADFEEGCWEPVVMQLPSGEIQLFFANEYQVPDKQQHIAMMRSLDNGATWGQPEVVCFRTGSRDGMPVPVCLQQDKGLALAIEDNGLNGAFKPVIIHTTMQDNWKSGTVLADSPNRWSALAESDTLPAPVYAGAPYLIQLSTGETLLSFQSGEGRKSQGTLDHSLMQVYVGDAEARNFCCRTTPFPFPYHPEARTLWCALEQTDERTVMATASVSGLKRRNGIQTSTGRIFRPMKARRIQELPDWDSMPDVMFIGAESQAQVGIKAAWDADSLYFHFRVADSRLSVAPIGNLPEMSDGVELYIDRTMKGNHTLTAGMFRILANVAGTARSQSVVDGKWTAWDGSVRSAVTLQPDGYTVDVAIPWNKIKGKPNKEGLAVCFRLHNNDAEGVVYHENMPGANPDRPYTWMRCTF
ncbi:MAG: exo-alpha-sialidase [Bacteroidaceae bacterium]|nr:exo-alpha-sialidase [Bacteroidaceae bacterium]